MLVTMKITSLFTEEDVGFLSLTHDLIWLPWPNLVIRGFIYFLFLNLDFDSNPRQTRIYCQQIYVANLLIYYLAFVFSLFQFKFIIFSFWFSQGKAFLALLKTYPYPWPKLCPSKLVYLFQKFLSHILYKFSKALKWPSKYRNAAAAAIIYCEIAQWNHEYYLHANCKQRARSLCYQNTVQRKLILLNQKWMPSGCGFHEFVCFPGGVQIADQVTTEWLSVSGVSAIAITLKTSPFNWNDTYCNKLLLCVWEQNPAKNDWKTSFLCVTV